MKTAIVVSVKDKAGMNIKERLLELFDFSEKNGVYSFGDLSLYTVEKDTIVCEHIDKEIDADVFIFATRHQGNGGLSLSVHTPGNWARAEYGGEDRKLCVCWANLNRKIYLDLLEKAGDIDVTLECTHHGPLIDKPTVYVEIGSSENEWENKEAAEIIAKTIVDVMVDDIPNNGVVFGIGGPHYCNNFNKLLRRTEFAVGHVCPKHMLEKLDKEMIKEAIAKTKEGVEFVLLDWKGLGGEKQRIMGILDELGVAYKRTDQLDKA